MSIETSTAYSRPKRELINTQEVMDETLKIMQDRLHECLVASRHIIITEGDRKIHLVGVKFHELWKLDNEYMYHVECGFLVIEVYSQMYIVESKNSYLIDEYTKFGSIGTMELWNKVMECEIDEDFQIAYKRMRTY